jgi:hypothetical protein
LYKTLLIVADFQDFPIVADFLVVVELVVLWWSKNMSMALATSSSSQARSPLSSQDVEEEEEKEEDKEVAAASSSSLVLDDAIEAESSRSFLMALQVSYKFFLFWVCVCVLFGAQILVFSLVIIALLLCI